jgi:hypothetical protein
MYRNCQTNCDEIYSYLIYSYNLEFNLIITVLEVGSDNFFHIPDWLAGWLAGWLADWLTN